nr:hypothetical protein [Alistipes sp.]
IAVGALLGNLMSLMSVVSLRINVGSALLNSPKFPKFPNFPKLSFLMCLFSPQAERLPSNN